MTAHVPRPEGRNAKRQVSETGMRPKDGERVASQVLGNTWGGILVNAKFRNGKNTIILISSPGSAGQWVAAAAVAD